MFTHIFFLLEYSDTDIVFFEVCFMPTPNSSTTDTPDKGQLQVNLTSEISSLPIEDATVSISYTGVPDSQLEQLTTDSSGQTEWWICRLRFPPTIPYTTPNGMESDT